MLYIVAAFSVRADHLSSALVLRVVVCHQVLMCSSFVAVRAVEPGHRGQRRALLIGSASSESSRVE